MHTKTPRNELITGGGRGGRRAELRQRPPAVGDSGNDTCDANPVPGDAVVG